MQQKRKRKRKHKRNIMRIFPIFIIGIFLTSILILINSNHNKFKVQQVMAETYTNKNISKIQEQSIKEKTQEVSTNYNMKDYKYISKKEDDIYKGQLVLVNNKINWKFNNEDDFMSVYDYKTSAYKVKDKNVQLDKFVIEHLNNMMDDFKAEKNISDVIVVSGYRSYEYQQNLYNQRVAKDGKAEASKWVANAGGSEHHTGYALDFSIYNDDGTSQDYTGEGQYSWLNENCYKYGFIVRYTPEKSSITGVSYEPWHFRYVGIPHSKIMVEKNLCYEEYIDYLKDYEFNKQHLKVSTGNKNYEIYYIKAEADITQVPVPKNNTYTISGNNVDGFIISCEM